MLNNNNKNNNVSYEAKDIYVLEGLEPVRKRPGMYIGSTGVDGLHHLIWEVVDNSIDEAMAGFANEIEMALLPQNRVRVRDNGRGIPVETHKQTKKSALETVMCTLHAGGKFGGESYKVSGGLHGVGVSVVNALSKWVRVEVCRDGYMYAQEYAQGKPKTKVQKLGKCGARGTAVFFEPDQEIFKEIRFDWDKILDHLRQQAYLTRGVKITIRDLRMVVSSPEAFFGVCQPPAKAKNKIGKETKDDSGEHSYSFFFEGGIISYIKFLNNDEEASHSNIFYVNREVENIQVETALQYTKDIQGYEMSFANNIYTAEGGMHLTGFRTALTRSLNDYARKNSYLKNSDENLTGDDVREGLTAVVSLKLREPQFEGQTKAKLGNPEARTAVETAVSYGLEEYLEKNPNDAREILGKCILASKARQAAKAAKDTVLRKGILDGLALPGKLADCSSRNPAESELFIVEGDSAGGCLAEDTKVALVDGRNVSFKQLIEEDKQGKGNFCYTVKSDGNIGIAPIRNPRLTKRKVEVLKIILDNKEEIICTPDHKFMLRDGTYKEAKYLITDDSLMPFHCQQSRFSKLTQRGVVLHYNHKIKAIVPLAQKIDVYDIEVPETHNFALASGIFVHNSAKQGRDRNFQAILPLRGKILNVEKARLDKALTSKEVKALIIAMGTAIADSFDISKLRYHRIIIMTDADVDGAHIRTLLLTLFFRYFIQLIEAGHIYIAQPPLYRLARGKEVRYVYSDAEKETVLAELKKKKDDKAAKAAPGAAFAAKKTAKEETAEEGASEEGGEKISGSDELTDSRAERSGVSIQRYKGLGEMNPEQLWETTMDPANRVLKQVTIADAKEADKIFDILMGDEVAPRKRFIQTHAKKVKNLDI